MIRLYLIAVEINKQQHSDHNEERSEIGKCCLSHIGWQEALK